MNLSILVTLHLVGQILNAELVANTLSVHVFKDT